MNLFSGSGVALITPFTEDGNINYDVLAELIEFHISNGTDAIISCGTTGEAATLSNDEYEKLITFTVNKVNKRIPVIVGTGANNTKVAIEKSKLAESIGADGLLIVTPYYNKTTQNGLIEHFKVIASSVELPIILYNIPGRTGLNMLPETVHELSKIKNICGIKEASENISQVAKIAALCADDFSIYAGNDSEILPVLALGGKGVISTMANIIPKETHNIVKYFNEGNIAESRFLQLKYMNLIKYLFIETNPIPIKSAVKLLGYNVGCPRLPLIPMESSHLDLLTKEMKKLKLI